MPRYSDSDAVHAIVARLLPKVGEPWNPYDPEQRTLDLAGVVDVVRLVLGDAAARTVHIPVH
jgi:hypothetical protein